MSTQVIPNGLKLGKETPTAVKAYVRPSIHNTTAQNSYGPNADATIGVGTGQHGTYFDCRTSRLHFQVAIRNKSKMIDFVSLGRAGWAWLIREMSVRVNGIPIEQVRYYNTLCELEKIRKGEDPDPFLMTFPNDWAPCGGLAGKNHVNFIKPCMVNAMGNSWDLLTNSIAEGHFAGPMGNKLYTSSAASSTLDFIHGPNCHTTASGLRVHGRFTGSTKINGSGLCAQISGQQSVKGPYDLGVDWEKLEERVEKNRRTRNDPRRVANQYANVKYLPVMMKHAQDTEKWYWGSTYDFSSQLQDGVLSMKVALPVHLGTVGELNPGGFPAFMVGANRMDFIFKFASVEEALYVTMDPCRRVPTTLRDVVPYRGGTTSSKPAFTAAGVPVTGDMMISICGGPSFDTISEAAAVDYDASAAIYFGDAVCAGHIANGVLGSGHAPADLSSLSASAILSTAQVSAVISAAQSIGAVPQYVPVIGTSTTDVKGAWSTTGGKAFVGESKICFGTRYTKSRPQARRCTQSCYPLELPANHFGDITFEISGLEYHVEEIIFGDAVTDAILTAGVGGNAVMETFVNKITTLQLPQNGSQKFMIPLTAANATDLCVAFRDRKQLDSYTAINYPSYSFPNIFTRISQTLSGAYHVGDDSPIIIDQPLGTHDSGIGLQFMYGSERMPPKPLTTLPEILEYNALGDNLFYGEGDLGILRRQGGEPTYIGECPQMVSAGANYDYMIADPTKDGFFAAFVDAALLDDQSITDNPNMRPLLYSAGGRQGGTYRLPITEAPVGTFHISLNLESFKGMGSKMISGLTIMSQSIILEFQQAKHAASTQLEMVAYLRANAKMVFNRGGIVEVIS